MAVKHGMKGQHQQAPGYVSAVGKRGDNGCIAFGISGRVLKLIRQVAALTERDEAVHIKQYFFLGLYMAYMHK